MNTFKDGDRVTHPIRGIGTVVEDIGSGWYTVKYDKTGEKFMTDAFLLTLVPKTEPKFNVRVLFTNGNEVNAGDKYQQHAESYLQNLPDWDTIETITINRVKG